MDMTGGSREVADVRHDLHHNPPGPRSRRPGGARPRLLLGGRRPPGGDGDDRNIRDGCGYLPVSIGQILRRPAWNPPPGRRMIVGRRGPDGWAGALPDVVPGA